MNVSSNVATTVDNPFNQLTDSIERSSKIQQQGADKIKENLDDMFAILDFNIYRREVEQKAAKCKLYCSHNTATEAKPKNANEIKIQILDDLKSGIEILKENNPKHEVEHLHKVFKLLHSKDLDISKLDIIKQYDDKQCKYINGSNQTGYTVVYNNIELFTITNIDSPTRFPDTEKLTSGLDFNLEFHLGFNDIYSTMDLTTTNDLLNTKEKIEADIQYGIDIYTNKYARFYYHSNEFNKKIALFKKILKLLESDSLDLIQLQTKEFFGNYFSSKKGYTVFYNDTKLFTINNIDQGEFDIKYTRIKDVEVEFHDGFNKLYNSIESIVYDDARNTKESIQDDIEKGRITIQNNFEISDIDEDDYNKKIENINKILQLLDSNAIDILKLTQTNFTGLRDINNQDDYDWNDMDIESGYTVRYNDTPLFSINEIENDESSKRFFEIYLDDYFDELYT